MKTLKTMYTSVAEVATGHTVSEGKAKPKMWFKIISECTYFNSWISRNCP